MVPFPCEICRCSHNPSFSAHFLMMLYICTKSCDNISQYNTVIMLLSRHYFQTEIVKGHNSPKNVGRVMVLNLCTLSYDALYLVYICTYYNENILNAIKGLLHCFSTSIEITGKNWYCFNLKNVENCKEKFQRVKKL